jgi:DNA (cytosine-5)-methyltransferase 1
MGRSRNRFYAIDLFAGCGGLSEGFTQAGFRVIAQVEMDRWACETLRTRQLYYRLRETGEIRSYYRLLRGRVDRNDILKEFPAIKQSIEHCVIQAEFTKENLDTVLNATEASRVFHNASKFHVVIGGPPCQPYSLVGRSRDPDRMESDSRHFLYEYYLRILERLQPDFFVFENVPGLITAKTEGEQIFLKMLQDFRGISPSYNIAPSFDEYSKNPRQYLLDSNAYGIPQRRKRVIFIGYRESLLSMNPGVKNVFKRILKPVTPRYGGRVVEDAIRDLPALTPGEGEDGWYGGYPYEALTRYQKKMRRGSPGILNHRARTHMQSDLERYRFFIEHHLNGDGAANLIDLLAERPDLEPDHSNLDKFLDRFKVQWWDKPASTIMAHICKDGHYYIHPDIDQCRSFTVREAARCQSFPDNYRFEGPRTEQFRQVGNAVPPVLSRVIASNILHELNKIYEP